jgi:hypothetical protein
MQSNEKIQSTEYICAKKFKSLNDYCSKKGKNN